MASQGQVTWGVLSTANIGLKKVLPAMQQGKHCSIKAIASRSAQGASEAAKKLGIPKAYGSYEDLLDDPEIEAIYNPLPNHMHLEWTKKCIEAGKHVLCEKPLGLNPEEVTALQRLQTESGLLIGEAFMVLHHPRWRRVKEMIRSGDLGELKAVSGFFSYFNKDANDIRNRLEYGGGGVYDIGCYPVMISRYLFGSNPLRVAAVLEYDQQFKTDRLATVVMDFPTGHGMFTVSTQLTPYQIIQVFGTKKKLDIPLPFNTPNDRPTQILGHVNSILDPDVVEETFAETDQYMLQGDAFSKSIMDGVGFAGSLENAMGNARTLDAVFRAASSGRWEEV